MNLSKRVLQSYWLLFIVFQTFGMFSTRNETIWCVAFNPKFTSWLRICISCFSYWECINTYIIILYCVLTRSQFNRQTFRVAHDTLELKLQKVKCVPDHHIKRFEWSDHNVSLWSFTSSRRMLTPDVNRLYLSKSFLEYDALMTLWG